jgi:hypothetical protein
MPTQFLIALTFLTDEDRLGEMWKCVYITVTLKLETVTRNLKVPPGNDPTIFHTRAYQRLRYLRQKLRQHVAARKN